MAAVSTNSPQELELLDAARRGRRGRVPPDRRAHRAELHAHCYRMLGSLARRRRRAPGRAAARLAGAARVRRAEARCAPGSTGSRPTPAWTRSNGGRSACFRPTTGRRPAATDDPGEPLVESVWVEPYPDEMIGLEEGLRRAGGPLRAARGRRARLRRRAAAPAGPAARGADPARRARLLGPRGRGGARDDVASVNSALQRARKAVDERLPEQSQQATLRSLGDESIHEIVERYVDAWAQRRRRRAAALLAEDATFSMPPWAPGGGAARRSPASPRPRSRSAPVRARSRPARTGRSRSPTTTGRGDRPLRAGGARRPHVRGRR